jgi:prepilin-type N-terminal cleavage/methylation domain-containing protein
MKDISLKNRREIGYTLVEVLIASVLIGIAITSVFQVVSQSTRINREEFLSRRAYQYLEQILEDPQNSYKGSYYVKSCGTDHPTGNLVPNKTIQLGKRILDDRDTPADTTDDLTGTAILQVYDQTVVPYKATISGIAISTVVPYRGLRAIISYTENGRPFSDTLETIVTLVNTN